MEERRRHTRWLEAWAEENGVCPYPLVVHDFGEADADQGRATLAARPIKQGERILAVPFGLLLDVGAALRAEDVASVFAAVKPALDAVDNKLPLALFMLHELRKPDSFWRPYFDALPSRVNLPMFWSDDDLQLLAGSPLLAAVVAQKRQAFDWHSEHIIPTIQRYPQAFGVSDGGALPEAYSLARFEWVLSMIASRAFWHYDLDKAMWVPHMVPLADLINHSLTNQNVSKYTFDDVTQAFNVHVKQPYEEGEQVYITYCTDSNFELIKTYAMMVEDNEIKYTELTLFLDEVMTARICPNEGERLAKTSILARRGHAKQTYSIKSDELPLGLVQALRLYHLPLSDLTHSESACFETEPVAVENELAVYESVVGCVRRQLAQYPTTAEEDDALLAGETQLSPTARLAVSYRHEDKLFLAELGDVFEQMRRELAASHASPPLITELFFDCLAAVREDPRHNRPTAL